MHRSRSVESAVTIVGIGSLERRLKNARLGRFKPLADFDWSWSGRCDRAQVEEWMRLDFLEEAVNLILVGPNGVGKSTLARNIAHQAVLAGHTVLFTSAGQMLNDLAAQDGDSALKRRLARYARPQLLVIDEVGYLSYATPTAPSRNGARSSPTPRAWSPWWTAWCIAPRSSPSRGNPTGSRRRRSARPPVGSGVRPGQKRRQEKPHDPVDRDDPE